MVSLALLYKTRNLVPSVRPNSLVMIYCSSLLTTELCEVLLFITLNGLLTHHTGWYYNNYGILAIEKHVSLWIFLLHSRCSNFGTRESFTSRSHFRVFFYRLSHFYKFISLFLKFLSYQKAFRKNLSCLNPPFSWILIPPPLSLTFYETSFNSNLTSSKIPLQKKNKQKTQKNKPDCWRVLSLFSFIYLFIYFCSSFIEVINPLPTDTVVVKSTPDTQSE